jgi:phage/plasmid-associated DNA primase
MRILLTSTYFTSPKRQVFVSKDSKHRQLDNATHTSRLYPILPPARMAVVTELQENDHFNTQLLRNITGGDELSYRGSGVSDEQQFSFFCQAKIFFGTERIALYDGTEKGMENRHSVIPCKTRFTPNPDPNEWT